MNPLVGFEGMDDRAIAWTVAGSDSGGGAGVQADLKTFAALGAHGCSVLTSLTAQNTLGVTAVESASAAMVEAQWHALASDLPARCVKTGMLADETIARTVAALLESSDVPYVCDPVMISSSGHTLLETTGAEILRARLVPRATLVTPNLHEAAWLAKLPLTSHADVEDAAAAIRELGAKAVLIKGGHFRGEDIGEAAWDYFTDGEVKAWILSDRLPFGDVHGTGCVLSAAITAAIARGYPVRDAVILGRAYIVRGIRHSRRLSAGMRTMCHAPFRCAPEDFPRVVFSRSAPAREFPTCGAEPLGFYPIVDRVTWLERLLPLGVRTVQLRVKDLQGEALEREVATAVELCRGYDARLFVNDYWDLALKYEAYGVHLGQEDVLTADLGAIARAGLRLGVSTHCPFEVAVAHGISPSYMAVGPVYPTTLKVMPFAPLTPGAVAFWKSIVPYPIVAIGGISLERAPEVMRSGADGIAVVSDVTAHAAPESRVRTWLALPGLN